MFKILTALTIFIANFALGVDYQPPTTQGEIWGAEDKELTERTFELMKKKLMHRDLDGTLRRAVHPKAHGCIKAKLIIDNSRLDDSLKVGLFAENNEYESIIRFSNGAPLIYKPDVLPDARGMALKIFDIPYENYLSKIGAESNRNEHDIVLINSSNFFLNDNRGYVELLEGITNPIKLFAFAIKNPKSIAIMLRIASWPIRNPLFFNYHSSTPYKLAHTSMKMMFRACEHPGKNIIEPIGRLHPNYLRKRLKRAVHNSAHCFSFFIQPNNDLVQNRIEAPMLDWETVKSPYILVGELKIPKQKNWYEYNSGDSCQKTSFNPWRAPEENRPMGRINRARLDIYLKMAKIREEYNGPN